MMSLLTYRIIFATLFCSCWAVGERCASNLDCGGSSFCKMYTGMCNGPYGYCTLTTVNCFEGTGVCGCDAKNYNSECEAAKYNVSVLYQGKCLKDGNCKTNRDCGGNARFCEYQENCNSYGVCRGVPEKCPLEIGVVCGCNGQNFMNECHAAANGTSIMQIQPCKIGYCTKNEDCELGSMCLMLEGICNGDASQGVCVLKPPTCSQEYAPVCGCDERTYPNACIAIQQGASINSFLSCSQK